jgi:hypothetical protein
MATASKLVAAKTKTKRGFILRIRTNIGCGQVSVKAWREYASALARLEAALHLIDDVHLALATDEAVGAVTGAQRFQRVPNFHLNTDGK